MSPRIPCEDFRKFIDAYLDGEFDDRDRAEFDAHAAGCPDCREQLVQQIGFRRAVRPHLRQPAQMPTAARQRLRANLRAAERPARRARWVKRLAVPVPALAAVGVAILLITPLTGFVPVVDEVVDQHTQVMPVEVPSDEASEVDEWFRDKVPFSMRAPRFGDQRVTLLGGRLSHLRTSNADDGVRQAAYLIYGVGRQKLTVLVFKEQKLDLERVGQLHRINGRQMALRTHGDFRVALYQKNGLTYAVTSQLSEPEMVKLVGTAL